MTPDTHLVVCMFDGETMADEARQAIRALDARLDTVKLGNIAVLSKNTAGTIDYWESSEVAEERRNSIFGMVVGWVFGLAGLIVGSPAGPVQAGLAGELVGASAPIDRDYGFPDQELRHLAESLDAGSSVLITLVHPAEAALVVAELDQLGGHLIQRTLAPEVVTRLLADTRNGEPL